MKTTEATTTLVPASVLVNEENETNNYAAVRYNAITHGILSKHVVLPHEDKGEFESILTALSAEYQPSGMTEAYLVEELAGIMWRKRRVLLAEGSTINSSLRGVLDASYHKTAKDAVPFAPGLPDKPFDAHTLMTATPEEVAQTQEEIRHDLRQCEKAMAILNKGSVSAYAKALKTLLPDSRDWWLEYVEKGEYQANVEGLRSFLDNHLFPIGISLDNEARYHDEIKSQTIGESLPAGSLEKLNRYETHLDRKFEKTLAMLLKLKELGSKK